MEINELSIKNFRKFKNLSISFNPQMNVIVGNNGDGKSSILEALSIAAGSFFLGIEGIPAPGIKKTDIRFDSLEIGSTIDRQPQLPVEIECQGTVCDTKLQWSRELNTESGNTTIVNAGAIKRIANGIQTSVREGDKSIILPIISYYGTGRLWKQKKEKQKGSLGKRLNRFNGYTDSLSAMSNEKMMLQWFEKMTMQKIQDGIFIPELDAVERAVKKCFCDSGITVDDVRVRYSVKSQEMEVSYIDADGKKQRHPFHELSDGFKNTLSLVSDIAYRMAVLNPQLLENVVSKTPGIVIIDEIDQHLHPKWQKRILNSLMDIFPKVQFIVSTHSPSIISSARRTQLIVLEGDNCVYPTNNYGKDVNSVLSELMDVNARPDDIEHLINQFYDYLDDEDFDNAKKALNSLVDTLGDNNGDVISAKVALDFETA